MLDITYLKQNESSEFQTLVKHNQTLYFLYQIIINEFENIWHQPLNSARSWEKGGGGSFKPLDKWEGAGPSPGSATAKLPSSPTTEHVLTEG